MKEITTYGECYPESIDRFENIGITYFEDIWIYLEDTKTSEILNYYLGKLTEARGFKNSIIYLPRGVKADEALISELALRGCKFCLIVRSPGRPHS